MKVNITCVDSVSQALTLAQTVGSAVISTYSASEYSAPRDTRTSLKDVVWRYGIRIYYHNVQLFGLTISKNELKEWYMSVYPVPESPDIN